jgi:UDP-N-acetylmuramate dehydrogenase
MTPLPLPALRAAFGDALQEKVPLAAYTTARIGGAADALLVVRSADELAKTARQLWEMHLPFILLGSGSNVLISDAGVRGVVVINRASEIRFTEGDSPSVWAESGANFSRLANLAAERGLSGLEWAVAIPGTLGGAVYGNAGAFGGDIANTLRYAEIISPSGREQVDAAGMGFVYRGSRLKGRGGETVILAAEMRLRNGTKAEIRERIRQFSQRRRETQPPGASMGSIFKNPPGDYAGRLIDAAGLKGTRIGDAEISEVHANFFLNRGNARAEDMKALIRLAQRSVEEKFGVRLELEIELIGEWL